MLILYEHSFTKALLAFFDAFPLSRQRGHRGKNLSLFAHASTMGSDAGDIISKIYPETIEEVDRLCVSARSLTPTS